MFSKVTKFLVFLSFFGLVILALQSQVSFAQENQPTPKNNEYYQAKVIKVINEETKPENTGYTQTLKVLILEGPDKGLEQEVKFEKLGRISEGEKNKEGEYLILIKTDNGQESSYFVAEKYRLTQLYVICGIFVLVSFLVVRVKGLFSLAGLVVSILILIFGVVPALIAGYNAILVCLIGAFLIALSSMYLAHGVNRRTTVALFSTLLTILVSVVLAIWFVNLTKLVGLGSDDALYLQSWKNQIDLQGLLLGGIIIGTLGILDDITVSQVSIVEELHDVDPNMNALELFRRGSNIGKEHIASLINTLALAYVGASFPLLLSFSVNSNQTQPLWVILNSEFIMEEIVRTLVGSTTLILAVPISTVLAAYFVKHPFKFKNKKLADFYEKLEPKKDTTHAHHHH